MNQPAAALRDRIADAVIPLLLDTLPKVIARSRGYEVADTVLGVLPPPADRAAILAEAADAVFALDYDVMVGEEGDENLGSMREAWDLGTIHAEKLLRRLAAEKEAAHLPADRAAYSQGIRDAIAELERDAFGAIPRLRRLAAEAQPTTQPETRQPAYDAVFAYIRSQPRDFLPSSVVDRNAMIWHAVHAALDAVLPTEPAAGVRQDGVQP